MTHRAHSIFLGVATVMVAASLGGCLKNDIPYPRIQPNFLTMEAPELLQPAAIDSASRLVTLTFNERADLQQTQITSYSITPGARVVMGDLEKPINLEKPYIVGLQLYQQYDWVITAVQNIERYFTVADQVGPSIIDVAGQRVIVKVNSTVGLANVRVLSMKLGPEGSITTPDLVGKTIDLNMPVEVHVIVHGRDQLWTIHGEEVEATVVTVRADAWTNVAWIYGQAIAGRDNGVEYRMAGSQQWTRAPKEWVTNTGATFYARLINLQEQTAYEARTYSDQEFGATVSFTTGASVQVPNSSLSEWSKDGKVWNPWAQGAEPYWDTGNKGATTLGQSNSTPSDITSTGTGTGAQLLTKFVGIGTIGKIAAGNIFAGVYVATDGTNGILTFGRPFTERPTRLRGYCKYTTAPISKASTEFADLLGRPDTCNIYCALIDSQEPIEVRTNPKNRVLFDPSGSYVIAYGHVQYGETIPDFIHFDIELQYNATNRVPRYIVIVASASKYGDYFTGGNGACLWIDDLNLEYDY